MALASEIKQSLETMLSGFLPFFSSDDMLENLHQTFNGVYTPWDLHEIFSSSESHEFVVSNSSSDVFQFPAVVTLSQSSDYRTQNEGDKKRKSEPEELNQNSLITPERKQRRMMSNRESARRSRLRTKKHLENLRNQVNRLRTENHGYSNRLLFVLRQNQRVWTENDRLQSEYNILQQKLSVIRQILVCRKFQQLPLAWPYNLLTPEQTPPLIA